MSSRVGFVIKTRKIPPALGYNKYVEEFYSRFPEGEVRVLGVYSGFRYFDACVPHGELVQEELFWQEFCRAHNIDPHGGVRMSER